MKHAPDLPESRSPQDSPKGSFGGICMVILFIVICIACALFSSCTRKVYLPVEHTVYRTDTLRQTALRIDSIYFRDSISLTQHGDTILIEKYRDRFRYINRTDTLYQSKTDSIRVSEPYPVEVVKEVAKSLAWWQKTLMWIGAFCLVSFVVVLYILLRKK